MFVLFNHSKYLHQERPVSLSALGSKQTELNYLIESIICVNTILHM